MIIQVPRNLALCGALATETFGMDAIKPLTQAVSSPEKMTLMIALLVERARGPSSAWHEYITMLPREALVVHRIRPEEVEGTLDPEMMSYQGWHRAAQERRSVAQALSEASLRNESYVPHFAVSKEEALWAGSLLPPGLDHVPWGRA